MPQVVLTKTPPELFICQLENKMMFYPVKLSGGKYVGRQAIINWLAENRYNAVDPNLFSRFQIDGLIRDINQFLKNQNIVTCQDFFKLISEGDLAEIKKVNYLAEYWSVTVPTQYHNDAENVLCLGPLHLSILNGDLAMTNWLITNGADLEQKNFPLGYTPLHLAVQVGFTQGVGLLLKYGADIEAKTFLNETALHLEARSNNQLILPMLLSRKVNLDVCNGLQQTPIWVAQYAGQYEKAAKMMQYQKDLLNENKIRQISQIEKYKKEIADLKKIYFLSKDILKNSVPDFGFPVENNLEPFLPTINFDNQAILSTITNQSKSAQFIRLDMEIKQLNKDNANREMEITSLNFIRENLAELIEVQQAMLVKLGYVRLSNNRHALSSQFSMATVSLSNNNSPNF